MEECVVQSAATPLSRQNANASFFFTIHVSLTIRYAIMNHNLSVAMKSSDFQSRHIINKNKKIPINPIRENWIELQQFA